jgi:maleate isomerase
MLTEVFPRDFYRVVPPGVSLVITTLAVHEFTSDEVSRSLEIARRVATEMGRAGVDLVVLGGVPINLSAAGPAGVSTLIEETRQACGVPVTTSLTAQMTALEAVGAHRLAVVHPFAESHSASYVYVRDFGFEPVAVKAGGYPAIDLGRIPSDVPVRLAREAIQAHPDADTLYFPCPHWAVVDRIDELEAGLGLNVVTSGQAILWEALRRCGIDETVHGYGRLFRDH